jgi:uncharacterized protein (DUF1501 family)
MIDVGSFKARLCEGVNRRAFLKAGLLAPLGLTATQASSALAAESKKVRSVVLLWLWGAPSHVDTFDPKPNAPAEFRGPFSTIPTRTPGVRFTELLPRLAARSDRFTLIRSNRNFHSGHTEAGTIALTGALDNAAGVQPNFGSIVSKGRPASSLPSFLAVGRGFPRDVVGPVKGYGGGNWGKVHDPFLVHCSDVGDVDIPTLKLLDGLTPAHLQDRRELLKELDSHQRKLDQAEIGKWDNTRDKAYALLTSPEARRALDVTREKEAVREAYGQTSFGQSCLLARRLVEAGVSYVQVNWSQYVESMTPNCDFGWDTHIYNFEMLPDRHCPILDRVLSAFLDDLHQRGLLESTLVIAMGEFGRSPRITPQAARDHWPNVYFSLWAGGGVQPGRVIGESDRLGQEPLTEAITPTMVGTTILERAGFDAQARAELRVLPAGRVIHELF